MIGNLSWGGRLTRGTIGMLTAAGGVWTSQASGGRELVRLLAALLVVGGAVNGAQAPANC